MARSTNTTVTTTVLLNGKQAEAGLKTLTKELDELEKKKKELNEQGLFEDNSEEVKKLTHDIQNLEKVIKQLQKGSKDVSEVISNMAGATENQLRAAAKVLIKINGGITAGTEEWKKNAAIIVQLKERIERMNEAYRTQNQILRQQGTMWDNLGKTIKRLASYVIVYFGFNELMSGFRKVYNMNVALSDQLADISKVTNLAGRELAELSDDINKINTRTSVQQLNKLAYEAGKIGKTSKEDVLGFVKAGNQIRVALGEDLGEDAIKNIAKLNHELGVTKQLGVEKSMLATGSAINELGQSSVAAEKYLVDFASRLGGIASQANLTVTQVLALGSVTDQLGQNVEVSATALNRFITTVVSKTDQVAKAVGVTAKELRDALGKSTWEGLMLVFNKLADKGGLPALAPIMGDLGSEGARLTAVLSAVAGNVDLVNREIGISEIAFKQATSITKEYNKKNENLAATIEKIGKNITKSFTKSDFVNKLGEIADHVYKATSNFDEFGNRISGATNLIMTLIKWLIEFGTFILRNVDLIGYWAAAWGVAEVAINRLIIKEKAFAVILAAKHALMRTGIVLSLAWSVAINTITGNSTRAAAATALFSKAIKGIPFMAVATAIAGLVIGVIALYREFTRAEREMKAFYKSMNESMGKEIAESTYLFGTLKRTNEGSAERAKLIDEINQKYGTYLPNLLTDKTTNEELGIAMKIVNEQLQQRMVLQMKRTEIENATAKSIQNQLDLISDMRKETNMPSIQTEGIIDEIQAFVKDVMDAGETLNSTWSSTLKKLHSLDPEGNLKGEFQSSLRDYIEEMFRAKKEMDKIEWKYSPLISGKPVNQAPEVTITAKKLTIPTAEETEKEAKDRIKGELDAIETWINAEKKALAQSRVERTAYAGELESLRGQMIDSEMKYNESLEKIEWEGLKKKLDIANLEKSDKEKLQLEYWNFRKKLFDKQEKEEEKFQEDLDKIYDKFELKSATRDQRELIRIQQQYDDAQVLLKKALEKKLITEEDYATAARQVQEAAARAEKQYFDEKASKDANAEVKRLNEQQAAVELLAAEHRLAGVTNESEYKARLLEIEMEYQEKRLKVNGLTEEQITELKRQNYDRQIQLLDQASRKQEQIQRQYADVVRDSLEGLGSAFSQFFSNETDAGKAFGDAMIDIAFDSLSRLVDIWLTELQISSVKNTAGAAMTEVGTKGLAGIATAAVTGGIIQGFLQIGKAGLKALIGKGGNSGGATGQRVVKGYAAGGFVSGGPGGYTGNAPRFKAVGVVHGGEYEVPQPVVQHPMAFAPIKALEAIRQSMGYYDNPLPVRFRRRGYADGGFVGDNPVAEAIYTAPQTDPRLTDALESLEAVLYKLSTEGLDARVNYSNLERMKNRIETSRARGSRKK